MNKIDVNMCENRGYSVFSHSYTLKAVAVDPTTTLVCGDEDVIEVDNEDDDDIYWKNDGHLQAPEMPSFTSSTVHDVLPPPLALLSFSTLRGLDSPANPILIRDDPNSTTIV